MFSHFVNRKLLLLERMDCTIISDKPSNYQRKTKHLWTSSNHKTKKISTKKTCWNLPLLWCSLSFVLNPVSGDFSSDFGWSGLSSVEVDRCEPLRDLHLPSTTSEEFENINYTIETFCFSASNKLTWLHDRLLSSGNFCQRLTNKTQALQMRPVRDPCSTSKQAVKRFSYFSVGVKRELDDLEPQMQQPLLER